MKILFYINVLDFGGAERVISNLANAYSEENNEVIVVNTYKTNQEYYLNSKIKHLYLEEEVNQNVIIKNIKRISQLRKILKKYRPDIAVSFMAEPNIRLLIAARGLSVKKVISVRNDPEKEYASKISMFLIKKLMPKADGVVFQTAQAKEYFNGYFRNSKIIWNPVRNVFYSQNTSERNNHIVTVGRLTEQKNHQLLIRAFNKISNMINCDLYIYGDGNMREILKKLITDLKMENRIFLKGTSNHIETEIHNSKMFVLSSDYEGMPNALMEAMALGLPCISTDCPCGGPCELLEKKCLVCVGNEEKLAEKLLEFCNNDELCTEQSNYNKEKALNFHENVIQKNWYSYFKEILGE